MNQVLLESKAKPTPKPTPKSKSKPKLKLCVLEESTAPSLQKEVIVNDHVAPTAVTTTSSATSLSTEVLDYCGLSKEITKAIPDIKKKENGIYFTPPSIIQKNLERWNQRVSLEDRSKVKKILEPSCGSCEYIRYLNQTFHDVEITGIEYIPEIYEKIKDLPFTGDNSIRLLQADYLSYDREHKQKYDLIIGNPPYLVVKKDKKNPVMNQYMNFMEGRPNLFILFLLYSLEKLAPRGILSFILPKNFMNCLYYDQMRQHLVQNYTILEIMDCSEYDDYLETKQDTILLMIQNARPTSASLNEKWALKIHSYTILNTEDNIRKLKSLYEEPGCMTLNTMGFDVTVGKLVWNQHKDILCDDPSETRLIYSSDIKNNQLECVKYKDPLKKNFIKKAGDTGMVLVLNRGYGKGKYHFNYCLIDTADMTDTAAEVEGGGDMKISKVSQPYLIENHLICVQYVNTKQQLSRNEMLLKYRQIMNSFQNKKTEEFIDLYFGNNALNTTEIKYILPIYL